MAAANLTALDCDFTLREVPFEMGGKKFVIKEASAHAISEYRKNQFKGVKIGPDGKPVGFSGSVLGDTLECDQKLVAASVFELPQEADPSTGVTEIAVKLNSVLAWPDRIVRKLAEKIKEISDFGEGEGTKEALEEQIKLAQEKLAMMTSSEEERKNS